MKALHVQGSMAGNSKTQSKLCPFIVLKKTNMMWRQQKDAGGYRKLLKNVLT